MTTKKQVDDFLALKRVAVVGVSRNPKELSYTLWQELRQRRYEAIPVNPAVKELDGQTCYAKVQEIQPPVEGVLIMTSAKATDEIVHDCAEAGVKHVWMYGGDSGSQDQIGGGLLRGQRDRSRRGALPVHVPAGHARLPRPAPPVQEADRQLPAVVPGGATAGAAATLPP